MNPSARRSIAVPISAGGAQRVPIGERLRPALGGVLPRLSILHVITRLDRGGSSDCTLLQAIAAARRGHRVTIACGRTRQSSPLLVDARRLAGLEIVDVPHLRRDLSLRHDVGALLFLSRLLRARRFDIVHTHTSKAGALGRLAAALSSRVPVVHQPHGHLFYGYHGPIGTRLVILAERLLAPLARRHIVLSWRGAEEHLARGVGRPGQFTVVRSGIDLRPFRTSAKRRSACRERLGLRDDEFAVGTLCRLEPIKGVDDLLRGFLLAASSRPRLRLFFAGDGPLRNDLLDAARRAGASARVALSTSWVAGPDYLPALDLFALVSRNEGMGRALVEAMAAGLPVLATNVGGMPEVLEEGRAGLLIPPGDDEAIARAIARLMDDAALRASLARRARSRAVVFGAGRMGHALLRVYREVLR